MSGAPLWLRLTVGAASRLAPERTARLAHRVFRRPAIARRFDRGQRAMLTEAEVLLKGAEEIFAETPSGRLRALRFPGEPGAPLTLLLHAWTADSRAMAAFTPPLREAGHALLIPDLPAHGRSEGRETDAPASARAVAALLESLGAKPDFFLAHSFGGGVAGLLALNGIAPRRFACIASPSTLRAVTDDFAAAFALHPRCKAAFERLTETEAGMSLDALDGLLIWPEKPTQILLLHAPDDAEIAYREAERLATLPNARLHPLPGLGHRDVLWREESVSAAVRFLLSA